MKIDFIKATDELPGYGIPVLIRIEGVVQQIIYIRKGASKNVLDA